MNKLDLLTPKSLNSLLTKKECCWGHAHARKKNVHNMLSNQQDGVHLCDWILFFTEVSSKITPSVCFFPPWPEENCWHQQWFWIVDYVVNFETNIVDLIWIITLEALNPRFFLFQMFLVSNPVFSSSVSWKLKLCRYYLNIRHMN